MRRSDIRQQQQGEREREKVWDPNCFKTKTKFLIYLPAVTLYTNTVSGGGCDGGGGGGLARRKAKRKLWLVHRKWLSPSLSFSLRSKEEKTKDLKSDHRLILSLSRFLLFLSLHTHTHTCTQTRKRIENRGEDTCVYHLGLFKRESLELSLSFFVWKRLRVKK